MLRHAMQVQKQVQRRWVRPVQILEHQHQGAAPRRVDEQRGDCVEQPVALCGRIQALASSLRSVAHAAQPGDQLQHLRARPLQQLPALRFVQSTEVLAHDVGERLVGNEAVLVA